MPRHNLPRARVRIRCGGRVDVMARSKTILSRREVRPLHFPERNKVGGTKGNKAKGKQMSTSEIKSHLAWAIVSILMFWPTGIPAIIHALKVNKALTHGDSAEAMNESLKARKWCKITLITWCTLILLSICLGILSACLVSRAF